MKNNKLKQLEYLIIKNQNIQQQHSIMIENYFKSDGIAIGLIDNFIVNNQAYIVPLSTEENSVIIACEFANKIIKSGFSAEILNHDSSFAIYLEFSNLLEIKKYEKDLIKIVKSLTLNMEKRGGGFKKIIFNKIEKYLKITVYIDCCDSMGANLLNTIAEELAGFLKKNKFKIILSIVENDYENKTVKASFNLPIKRLKGLAKNSFELANNIIKANEIAFLDYKRAITHNKGILNGIEALALALKQDTRAICASIIAYSRNKPLTKYYIENDNLIGELIIPSAFATVGGTIGYDGDAINNLDILFLNKEKDSKILSMIAASIGLAQNFSALKSLVTKGIQDGHMKLHNKKIK